MENIKAHPLRPAAQDMKSPEDWQPKTAFGFMGYDSTPGGRLVRLADVLRWLGEHPHPLPYAVVLEEFCAAMPGDVMRWLYQVKPSGGYATPVPLDCMFGYQTVTEIEAAKVKASQDRMQRDFEAERRGRFGIGWRFESGKLTSTPPQPVEPGLPALMRQIKACWTREKFKDSPTIDHPKTAINYLAIPFDKAAQHWGWGRAPDVVVEPPEGWTAISKYGTQLSTRHGKLVRLEDVFDWMHSSGVSAHDAVYKIFSPYYEACIEGEECELLILNATEQPSDLARDGKKSKLPNVKFFASAFPDLGHVKFEDGSFGGLVYSMGEAALRTWRGKADVKTDHYARFKDREEAATDAKYGIQWPSDDASRKLLGRLAVPVKAADRLWSYGHVVKAHADTTQSEAATEPTGERVAALQTLRIVRDDQKDPTSWTELVSFRKEHPAANWAEEQKGILVSEFQARGRTPGAKGVAADMASELSITVSRFNELKRTASQQGKRTSARQEAA